MFGVWVSGSREAGNQVGVRGNGCLRPDRGFLLGFGVVGTAVVECVEFSARLVCKKLIKDSLTLASITGEKLYQLKPSPCELRFLSVCQT